MTSAAAGGRRLSAHQVAWLGLPLVVWMALIFYLSSQPTLPSLSESWLDLLLKKGGHFAVFGVLALLWWRITSRTPWKAWRVWVCAFALTLVYAISDESHQAFVPGRHPSLVDLTIDMGGAVVALGVLAWVRHRWMTRICQDESPTADRGADCRFVALDIENEPVAVHPERTEANKAVRQPPAN
jgi:VanZ family protein